ncbi:glycosyltransferase family 4 protein [Mucilaginibacter pedocola]|uniref:Glycosyl transferase family 1 domain-containing protein n=1 Tax=Mucilaginibacter pedocola TaxID=1792845 RepID=A0A1S9PAS6_9SPHI|nr:glycosyltransferase family 4 protein [Mucilaginibacter pedocola]OOQ58070.1 hypothetical protein BC343_10445 [Mucilaginibacter pedocola]
MKKHIIITKLYEFGGSNTHLETLIEYHGPANVILVLQSDEQLAYLGKIKGAENAQVQVRQNIHPFAHLQYKFTTNVKEFFLIVWSVLMIQAMSIKNGFADVTICATEPERHLYMLWMPLSRVYYILHTTPANRYTPLTPYTCNRMLGTRKKLVTVSNANKNTVCQNWEIQPQKQRFVYVVYNCLRNDAEPLANNPETKENKTVTTLGQVIAYKNPDTWLEVAKQVTTARPQVNFEWLGNGPLLDEYKQVTNGNNRIAFKGLVTQPGEYLKQASIYYQPSLYETHGIAVVEAMSYALPCVVSNTGGMPESVEDNYNGLLVGATDVTGHVNAILKLIDNESVARQYGDNSRKKYLEMFTYQAFTGAMDKIYA